VIAALYVDPRGPYVGRPDVETWDLARDARLYAGPHPVVAHPPCERWGSYWFGSVRTGAKRYELGADGGCFAAALAAVKRWGGVLEHPAGSRAWGRFFLIRPPRWGGWVAGDFGDGWVVHVEQGHYGHPARKPTWLYVSGVRREDLPDLARGASGAEGRIDASFKTTEERRKARKMGEPALPLLSKVQRRLTPEPFAELLIGIARSCAQGEHSPPREPKSRGDGDAVGPADGLGGVGDGDVEAEAHLWVPEVEQDDLRRLLR
jgi:hypothetical protein